MRCDEARPLLSQAADGELPPDEDEPLVAHVATCPDCAAYRHALQEIRQQLRLEAVAEVPDVASRVSEALRSQRARGRRPSPRLLRVAAVFVAGAVAGAAFVGIGVDEATDVASADLSSRVLAAQRTVASLSADVEISERGWHRDVPRRRFAGSLRYRAPESFALRLSDRSEYPSPAWVRNDVAIVVDRDRWWTAGPRDCPSHALPACTPRQPRIRAITHREPFSEGSPVPLELVTPVQSFALAGASTSLGDEDVAGRPATGVRVTAAQVAGLLSGFRPAGNLRAVHGLDPVDLWLDRETLVPLALSVRVGDDEERRRWAAGRGYEDQPGDEVLAVRLRAVRINDTLPGGSFPPTPPDALTTDDAFADDIPPARAMAGLRPHRAGTVATSGGPIVTVWTWTDGRAWAKVRTTTEWRGGRLFGDLGDLVRPVMLDRGLAHVSEDGSKVAIHGTDVDLVVTGSLPPEELLDLANDLGVAGEPLPAAWPEVASATLAQARRALPGLLVARRLEGFAVPAVRVASGVVSQAYAGPGDRGFVLVQAAGDRLAPPLDPDARGVRVRGVDGRYSPARGELEWVEHGRVVSLRSATLALAELVGIAEAADRR